jgi:hypothetical protein
MVNKIRPKITVMENSKCGAILHWFPHGETWCDCGEEWRTKEEIRRAKIRYDAAIETNKQ